MDDRTARVSQSDPDRKRSAAASLEIASKIVSPSSFLVSSTLPNTPPSLPVRTPRVLSKAMDKAQQPSSFQQLEKVSISDLFFWLYYIVLLSTLTDIEMQLGEGTYATVRRAALSHTPIRLLHPHPHWYYTPCCISTTDCDGF